MSAEIVNLNKARKKRDRAARQAQAAENRVKFGRTKLAKLQDKIEDTASHRKLDGARLSTDDDDLDPVP